MIRPLVLGDAAAAAALIRSAFAAQEVMTDPPPSALQETASSVAARLEAGGGACLTEGETIVALVLWAETEGGLYCGRLAVRPGFWGRGFARRLLAEAEREARSRGLPRLHLKVRLALENNRRLFAACGFAEIAREAHPGYAWSTSATLEKQIAAQIAVSSDHREAAR